jgi:hypothetical protein
VARLMPLAKSPPRHPGICRHWSIPEELFLEPMDEEDLRAAEGAGTDEYGITLPRAK